MRSILSGMQGLAALEAGRAEDPRLAEIGAAAQAGAWDLANWLEPDLPPLGEVLDPPEASYPGDAEVTGLPQVHWRDI